jgi:O-antigen ligase
MTNLAFDSSTIPVVEAHGGDRLLRSTLFLATFLLIWLTASPFTDLSDPALLEPVGDGNLFGQILAILVTVSLAAFVYEKKMVMIVLRAVTPVLVLTFLWFACSAALSAHAALASRRLVLAAFTVFQAAVFLLLPQDRDHFARLLAAGALIVLALCYAGVIFLPELSIHQSKDLAEPELAGNWRGFFQHKNGAGAAMALLMFFGIYISRSLNGLLGALIVGLSAVFLVFTKSKSPVTLFPLVLVFSFVFIRLHSPTAKFAVAASLPVVISILTIGSVALEPIHDVVEKLLSDPSFTGRNEIWRFALDHIAQRPIAGFGYQAFWGTAELVNNWTYLESWGYRASDAHNGFLNIAVMTGLVGLALSVMWIFVQPFLDQIRTPQDRLDPALNLMFLQVRLFGLSISGFESEIFTGGSAVWFTMAASIIGLHFQATAEYAPMEQ